MNLDRMRRACERAVEAEAQRRRIRIRGLVDRIVTENAGLLERLADR